MNSWTLPVVLALWIGALSPTTARAEDPPAAAVAANDRGSAKEEKGDLDGAIAEYSRAIELYPRFSMAYFNRGHLRRKKGDLDGGLEDYSRAIEIEPSNSLFYEIRAAAREDKGDLRGALADFTRSLQLFPGDAKTWYECARLKKQLGDGVGALADYARAIEIDPRFTEAYLNRGNLKVERGDVAGALADYGHAIEIAPRDPRGYRARAYANNKKGDLDQALADYTRAIEFDPRSAETYCDRGAVKVRSGDVDGGLADYARAIELDPRYDVAYRNRGRVKKSKGDFAGALADYTRAIELAPRSANGHYGRGLARWSLKDFGGAVADLRKALEINPLHDAARLFLFLAQALSSDSEAAARAALESSLTARPKPLDAGSWTGRLNDLLLGKIATSDLETIVEALPESRRVGARTSESFYAGMLAWIRGDLAQAVPRLERCAATSVAEGDEPAAARAVLGWPRTPAGAGPTAPIPPVAPVAPGPNLEPASLTWAAPAEWTRQPDRAMRAATFRPNAGAQTEIVVSVLVGTAGGTRANLDRWCSQMDHPPLSNADLAMLPRSRVLGSEAVFVSIEGRFAGMGGGEPKAGWRLFGMVLEREAGSVFVKVIGPRDEVLAEEARVRAFCESLRE